MKGLIKALMYECDCSEAEAKAIIADMKQDVKDGYDPEDVLYDYGLEGDHALALI